MPDCGLDKLFISLKCVIAIGEALHADTNPKHRNICCRIYDEIFSDGVSAVYLASCAMDKPANIVLRRILELGVACLYLWDMPHEAHSWDSSDRDLSFTEMLKHINSKGYLSFVSSENNGKEQSGLFPTPRSQEIYGDLSDIVHGKLNTFETALPDRFEFCEKDWLNFVNLAQEVLDIIICASLSRHGVSEKVFNLVPPARLEYKHVS